jgi:hypothetical protein
MGSALPVFPPCILRGELGNIPSQEGCPQGGVGPAAVDCDSPRPETHP